MGPSRRQEENQATRAVAKRRTLNEQSGESAFQVCGQRTMDHPDFAKGGANSTDTSATSGMPLQRRPAWIEAVDLRRWLPRGFASNMRPEKAQMPTCATVGSLEMSGCYPEAFESSADR